MIQQEEKMIFQKKYCDVTIPRGNRLDKQFYWVGFANLKAKKDSMLLLINIHTLLGVLSDLCGEKLLIILKITPKNVKKIRNEGTYLKFHLSKVYFIQYSANNYCNSLFGCAACPVRIVYYQQNLSSLFNCTIPSLVKNF